MVLTEASDEEDEEDHRESSTESLREQTGDDSARDGSTVSDDCRSMTRRRWQVSRCSETAQTSKEDALVATVA